MSGCFEAPYIRAVHAQAVVRPRRKDRNYEANYLRRETSRISPQVPAFLERRVIANDPRWREQRIVDQWLFLEAGKQGFLGLQAPRDYAYAEVDRISDLVSFEPNIVSVEFDGTPRLEPGESVISHRLRVVPRNRATWPDYCL